MDPRLMEHLERRRQARTGSEREVERLEEEGRRLQQEHQRLEEELEQERRGHQEILRRAEEQEREQTEASEVQQELGRSQAEQERRKRTPARAASGASHPWWRRPLLVVGLLLGVLIAWFTSLVVALNMLAS